VATKPAHGQELWVSEGTETGPTMVYNINSTGGGGVAVYGDHLEGTISAENVGWIRLGTHTGGSPHTYANTDANNYGVNRDHSGILSGYGWGENLGWISLKGGGAGPRPTGWSPIFATSKSICPWS
jgi:ELWxxDGT repeat protein